MITTIAKRFTFDAAHHLPMMPEGHKCRREHGHTYEVELVLRGVVRERLGMFVDYADIAEAWRPLHEMLDHHNLNHVPGLQRCPTTEKLVEWIMVMLQRRASDPLKNGREASDVWSFLHAVRVKESSSTWCEGLVSDFISGSEVVDAG